MMNILLKELFIVCGSVLSGLQCLLAFDMSVDYSAINRSNLLECTA